MAAPSLAPLSDVIAATRALIEASGTDAVTMSSVAAAVNIRTPSMYKKVSDRHELLRLAADNTARQLAATLRAALATSDTSPNARIVALATALRTFAQHNPRTTALLFATPADAAQPSFDALQQSLSIVLEVFAEAHPAAPLAAARLFTAWAYGFVTMQHAGAFRAGGDIDQAWSWGLETLLAALAR